MGQGLIMGKNKIQCILQESFKFHKEVEVCLA